MTANYINAQIDQSVYEIVLSRSDKLNALTDAMYGALVEHINIAQQDDKIKVIFLRSDSKHFCAGNDLADFLECEFNENSHVILFLRAIAKLTKPLVCAVGGAAVGIGTTMLLHCDLVFASKDSKFSVPFIKLGLTPEGGSSKLLAQRCGTAKANDWLLTGRTFLSQEALDSGLVTQLLPDIDATWSEAHKQAHKLAQNSLRVLQDTKNLLKGDQVESVLALIDKEAKVFAKGLQTDEAKSAFKAFLQG
ncbi:MAG: enoyl-CoA hydratase-related protein [Enterobacterales bacterium]|nr:enoyl-CoA hydratase-related protein [Enterobacterales bacterium]